MINLSVIRCAIVRALCYWSPAQTLAATATPFALEEALIGSFSGNPGPVPVAAASEPIALVDMAPVAADALHF